VQPTACYASEIWGLRHMPRPFKDIRASLGSHFVGVLRNLCGVRRSVPAAVMLHEPNFLPLQTQWQYSAIRLWNILTSLPEDSLQTICSRPSKMQNSKTGRQACSNVQKHVTVRSLCHLARCNWLGPPDRRKLSLALVIR